MALYKCAAGVVMESSEPCPRCGATEDSDEGCIGAKWDFERRIREEKAKRDSEPHPKDSLK